MHRLFSSTFIIVTDICAYEVGNGVGTTASDLPTYTNVKALGVAVPTYMYLPT